MEAHDVVGDAQHPLDFGQRVGLGREGDDAVEAFALPGDLVRQLALAPVVDRRDLALALLDGLGQAIEDLGLPAVFDAGIEHEHQLVLVRGTHLLWS
jgi:hypothetical protein